MSNQVIQLKKDQEKQVLNYYQTYQVPTTSPYMAALFKKEGVTISLYKSGKLLFQGSGAEQEAKMWGGPSLQEEKGESGQDMPLIGTDEVGNGSYFGGLYVVASYVEPKDHSYLRSLGVNDSKKLTDQHILQIAPQLMQSIPHKALPVSPKRYNQAIEQGYNAVSIKIALHNQAIFLLQEAGYQAEKIVIDAFTSRKNYFSYLKKEKNPVEKGIQLEEKAEGNYLAVAVSSIIARYLFLSYLEDISKQLGMKIPSGAGAQSDQVAAQLIQKYGMQALEETAKLHFANTQKAKKLIKP